MIERLDAHADAVNCAEDTFFQPNMCPRGDISCYPSKHLNLEKFLQILVQILPTGDKFQSSIFAVTETIVKFDSYQ